MRRVGVVGLGGVAVAVAACSGGNGDPTLTIARAGTAAEGRVLSAAGIDCGDDCSISVPAGVVVPLDAIALRGVVFAGWDGGGCSGVGTSCAVTVTEDVTVTATFDEKRELVDIPTTANRELDLLFVVDGSGGTSEEQIVQLLAFPTMIDVLDDVEGGLPDLHIGVVTSDMGVLAPTPDPNCADSDGGQLIKGDPDLAGQCPEVDGNYITSTNYTGTLADAFWCVALIGVTGCGFEQPLESMRAALDDHPGNAGFLRPDASLGVIILADEDDCSVDNPAFFGPDSPELGPLDSFRCFEKGIRCAEGRDVELRAEGPKTDCVVDDDSAYLTDLSTRYVDFLTGLETSRRNIGVVAITGDPAPVVVGRRTPTGSATPRPDLIPSCTFTDPLDQPTTADPGIRLRAFAEAFAPRGLTATVCSGDYAPVFAEAGRMFRRMVGYPCLDGALYAPDACGLAFVTAPGTPAEASVPLPMCTPALDNRPCWRTVEGDALCGARTKISVEHASPPPADSAVVGSCRID